MSARRIAALEAENRELRSALAATIARYGAADVRRMSEIVKRLRKRHYNYQVALAAEVGVTATAIAQWENGKRVPWPVSLRRLVAAFAKAGADPADIEALKDAVHGGVAGFRLEEDRG